MEDELLGSLGNGHKWSKKSRYPFEARVSDIPCTCKGDNQVAAMKMIPTIEHNNVIVWNNCARTLFAAMKRQVLAVPLISHETDVEWRRFCQHTFIEDIEPLLREFSYNPADWFNHLTCKQQQEIVGNQTITCFSDIVIDTDTKPQEFHVFCKRELQIVEKPNIGYQGSIIPKNRAIAGPIRQDKYVMGPVCWEIERRFEKLDGYCGGKNWNDLEQKIAELYQLGYRYVTYGDGSGWDRTQSHELKYIDRLIYEYIAGNAQLHIPVDVFLAKANSRHRKFRGYIFNEGSKELWFEAKVDATVGSGSNDTTLMNTTRMRTVVKFIMEQTGIDYYLLAKGDDFEIFTKVDIDLKPFFYKYWSRKNENLGIKHGLGITLKFLETKPINHYEFCSTRLIQEGDKFKIVRQPDRMYPLNHWSMKALAMSRDQRINYMIDIAESMEKWALGMPYYGHYIDVIYKLYGRTKKKVRTRAGRNKIILQDGTLPIDYDVDKGHEYYHKQRLRTSNTVVSDEAVYAFLFNQYGLTRNDIDRHIYTIQSLGAVDIDIVLGFAT